MDSSLSPAPLNSIRVLAHPRAQPQHVSGPLCKTLQSQHRALIHVARTNRRHHRQRVRRSIDGSAVDAVVGVVPSGSTRLAI